MRILLLCLLLFSMTPPASAQDGVEPDNTITTGSDAVSDEAIATRIRNILGELPRYSDVTVRVRSGVVTLEGTTLDAGDIEELSSLVSRVEGVVSIENAVVESTDLTERLDPAFDRIKARFAQFIAYLPLIFVALVIFAAIVAVGLLLARWERPWNRIAPNRFIANIYSQLALIVFIIVGMVVALDILNATALLGTILGAAGIIGLAIGFAVRDTVENFIASIMLSFRQPFRPNDAVEIDGDEGKVIRLTSRATVLLSFDGNHVIIPNSTVFKSRIVNYTRNAERRFMFEIGVASDADLEAVRELATRTAEELPFTLEAPAPLVWIDRIGDGAIFLTVTGWIDQRETSPWRAQGEALRQVKNAIEAAGVEVPDTTYRIQMLGGGLGRVTEDADGSAASPASKRPSVTREAAVADVAPSEEKDLEQLVDQERETLERHDLLDGEGVEE